LPGSRRRSTDIAGPGDGPGKRLFEGFTESLDPEHLGVRQSQFATFIDYRVKT
jgi:hypothetical protein